MAISKTNECTTECCLLELSVPATLVKLSVDQVWTIDADPASILSFAWQKRVAPSYLSGRSQLCK